MNKTNYYIECLELMGWIFLGRGIWRKPQGSLCGPLHEDELQSLTIQELIKRDGVLERVASHLFVKAIRGGRWEYNPHTEKWSRYTGVSFDYATSEQLVTEAISLGITPRELMGVEG